MNVQWLTRVTDNGISYLDCLVFDGSGWRMYSLPLWQFPGRIEVMYARSAVR